MSSVGLDKLKILDPVQTLTPGIGKKLDVLSIWKKPGTSEPLPAPAKPAAAPERTDKALAAASADERKNALRRRGRSATVLTGGSLEEAPLGRPAATSATLG